MPVEIYSMKIFDTPSIRKADELTIQSQNITSYDLMERAAAQVTLWLKEKFADKETVFHVFCGKGNNGGDGLVVAKMLHKDSYQVFLNIVGSAAPSPDFTTAFESMVSEGLHLELSDKITGFGRGRAVVIDAIFGIGLNREPEGEYKQAIEKINSSGAVIVSVDVPSGMFTDRPSAIAVQSHYVLTFQFSKLAFYLPGNYRFINEIIILDIGLDKNYIETTETDYYLIEEHEACARYKPVSRYDHKGLRGHTLIVGGSYGKTGAVVLAARAALTSGCGLVTAYLPECGYSIIQSSVPEVMALTSGEKHLEEIFIEFEPSAIAVGMGMGVTDVTLQAFHTFLLGNTLPLVADADALNMLAENKEWLSLLPENSIITPHPKELERLIGKWDNDFDKLDKIRAFSAEYKFIIVAKDARTMVVQNTKVYINSTGNAALATGGSGDVLAGIIAGLLAQGYSALNAAVFGVYLHGLTSDIGITEKGAQAFTASCILDYLGKAYLKVESEF